MFQSTWSDLKYSAPKRPYCSLRCSYNGGWVLGFHWGVVERVVVVVWGWWEKVKERVRSRLLPQLQDPSSGWLLSWGIGLAASWGEDSFPYQASSSSSSILTRYSLSCPWDPPTWARACSFPCASAMVSIRVNIVKAQVVTTRSTSFKCVETRLKTSLLSLLIHSSKIWFQEISILVLQREQWTTWILYI